MRLKGGLNLDDDQTEVKYQKADLQNASRERTSTQKNLDDMLFGSRPVRRRGQKPTEESQKKSTSETPIKNLQPTPVKKAQETPKVSPFPPRTPPRSSPQVSPNNKSKEAQNSNRLSRTNGNRIRTHESEQKSAQNSDRKKTEPVVNKVQCEANKVYNKPAYIRKLKKTAQNFEYHHINSQNHRYFNVIRQGDCLKQRILKQETPNFIDPDFPHVNCSIGHKHRKQQIKWKKSNQIYKKVTFGKYIDPNDIQSGKSSSPVFVSVLACLAQQQQNIKRLIENQSINNNGFYYVRVNVNGVWRYIAVDDYFAEINQESVGLRSYKDNQSDICLSLIQKAYAKAFQSYDIFSRPVKPEDYLQDLTGAKVNKYNVADIQLKQCIQSACKQNWTIIAQPLASIQEIGLDSRYCLCVKSFNNRGSIQLRNSWGTIMQKPKINHSKQGILQIKVDQFKKYFNRIIIAETNDQYCTSTIQSKHQKAFYSGYSFDLKNSSKIEISVKQWDYKLFPTAKEYMYSPFHIVLEKREKGNVRKFAASGFSANQQCLSLSLDAENGTYAIYCIGSWLAKGINYHLTVSASQSVNLNRIYINQSPKQITKCLENINIQQGKKTPKGQLNQYILYHQESNLVIQTVSNNSQKNQNYSQDLSKIKAGTIQLVTSLPTNDKKNEPLKSSRKTQNISLAAHESYTWVFSVSKHQKNANLREWGFR